MCEIAEGLWRWTARHPDWKPSDDWDAEVGCVYCETPGAVVLVDPLAPDEPSEQERLWRALDRDVERLARPVAVLLTVHWHQRSSAETAARYGGTVWRAGDDPAALPEGVEAHPGGFDEEVLFWLPGHRALVAGDVILGKEGGGLRLCPESWLPAGGGHRALRGTLRPLLALPIERVIVSHGEPVLEGGHAALEPLLAA